MRGFFSDVRFALRQINQSRLFSIAFVLLLVVGIGANTLIFSLIDSLLLTSLPVRDPQNLYLLQKIREKQVRPDAEFHYRQFQELAKESGLFAGLVAEQVQDARDAVTDTSTGMARLITTQIVSPNYFSELGIRAAAGRLLRGTDANASSDIPVVLSYQFWQARYGGSQKAIGQAIRLKDIPFQIVGVVPREFHSVDIDRVPDVRLPISAAPVLWRFAITDLRAQGKFSFQILARLENGIAPARAAIAIRPGLRDSYEWIRRQENPLRKDPLSPSELDEIIKWQLDYKVHLQPAGHGTSLLREQFSSALLLLMGGVGLLLLALCANLASLLLAKSEQRRKEMALRMALGAGRMRLARQLLTEGALLAAFGGVLGAVVAYLLCPLMIRFLPPARDYGQFVTPRVLNIDLNARILAFVIFAALLTCLLFSLPSAWRATRVDLHAEMKGGLARTSLANWGLLPITAQVALAVLLLTGAILMTRTFWNLESLNPGFDRTHIAEFTVDPVLAGYKEGQQLGSFYSLFEQRVAELPGVRSAGYADRGLMRGVGMKFTVAPQGVVLPKSTFLNASLNSVTPAYFHAMGIRLISGRNLDAQDYNAKPARIVVNRAFADLLFPRQNALGKGLVSGVDGTKPPTDVIVGIVDNAKYRSMREQDPPTCYGLLDEQITESSPLVLYVRTFGDPANIIRRVQSVSRQIDPTVPLVEVSTIDQDIENSLWQERLVAILSGFFGIAALLLASVGLYGTIAYQVTQRARELGVRMALGARLQHILQAICTRIGLAVLFGLFGGLIAACLALHEIGHFVYGVKPLDALSFAAAIVFILLCSALAAGIPSYRAAKLDPANALRKET